MGEVIRMRGVEITVEPHLDRLIELAMLKGNRVVETYVEALRRELATTTRPINVEVTVTVRPSDRLLDLIEREPDLIEVEILGDEDLG